MTRSGCGTANDDWAHGSLLRDPWALPFSDEKILFFFTGNTLTDEVCCGTMQL